jgi:hypothetical protein
VRFQNLYAEEYWRRNWMMGPLLLVIGGAFAVIYRRDPTVPWLVAESVAGAALILVIFSLYRRMSYVLPSDDGLLVHWSIPFRSMVIPWESIRQARVAPLKNAFPDSRRRMINSITKPLLERPAFYARLDSDGDEVAYRRIMGRLGRRYVFDGMLAVPVADAEKLAEEVTRRLPNRSQPNLGGARRRKRRR